MVSKKCAPKNCILQEICFNRPGRDYAYGSGGLVALTEAMKSPFKWKNPASKYTGV